METLIKNKQDDQPIISYKSSRLIKIFDVRKDDDVSYLIKTLLSVMSRWPHIEIHILMARPDHEAGPISKLQAQPAETDMGAVIAEIGTRGAGPGGQDQKPLHRRVSNLHGGVK